LIIAVSITLFFIVLRFTVTLFNFISNPKLTRVNKQYHDLVSILIPARDEADNIISLLTSIRDQDYQSFEVYIYDDESSDQTFNICTAFAASTPRFHIIKGGPLREGWLGKNNACHQLAKKAKGQYLLFLDADEVVSNGLINSAVHRMKTYRLALLSLFANQEMITLGEKTTVPLLHYLLLNLLPLRLVFLVQSAAVSTACGQFMLFEAASYHQNQWHKQARGKIVEDAAIMKLIKEAKYNGEVLLANNMLSCRMYHSYRAALDGLSKNALAAFDYSLAGLMVYILLVIGGPMIILMTLNLSLIFFMTSLILLSRVMVSLSAAQNAWRNIVFHPVQMINLTAIAFLSVQRHLSRTNIWKGRRM